jgi:quercetin dioxygenase-like cupin family protein
MTRNNHLGETMKTVRTRVRNVLNVVLFTLLIGIVVGAGEVTAPTTITPVVKLDIGEAARKAAKTAIEREILPGEIPGIRSTMISLAPGVTHRERASSKEDRVFLVLSGKGMITANGKRNSVTKESIAHFPIGWSVDVKASGTEGLDILILRLTITPMDRENLAAHPDLNSVAYVKSFSECEAYGEAPKPLAARCFRRMSSRAWRSVRWRLLVPTR